MKAVKCSVSCLIRNESAHLNVFGIETRLTMCENMVAISGFFESLSLSWCRNTQRELSWTGARARA